jgi:hypothetical protein
MRRGPSASPLSNACKFTKAGEVKLAARKVSNGSSFVEFAVSDTGIGMTGPNPTSWPKCRGARSPMSRFHIPTGSL